MDIRLIKEQVREYMFKERRRAYLLTLTLPTVVYSLLIAMYPLVFFIPQRQMQLVYVIGVTAILLYTSVTLPDAIATSIVVGRRKETMSMMTNYRTKGFRYFMGYCLTRTLSLLWGLCLIVPGFMKRYSYMMVPYIIRDNPDISVRKAIAMSRDMIRGERHKAFRLYLFYNGFTWVLNMIIMGCIIGFVYSYLQVDGEIGLAISFFILLFTLFVRTIARTYAVPRWIVAKSCMYHAIKK